MNRAQSGDEKNGVICLFIMFTSKIIVIKMSRMADCFFCRWQQKNSGFGQMYMKNPTELFPRMVCFKVTVLLRQQKILKPSIFKGQHLANYQPLEFNNP